MSNFNYMDNVPVKIAEKYKPLPRIYQLPQVVVNKLQLPEGHYFKEPSYKYDFQLEKKVQTKIPEYRRMRQLEREARQTRREKREQERQRQVEENHKQMLAECSYPNAAELSSSESDDEENSIKATEKIAKVIINKDVNWRHHNFDNILQPTVLTLGGDVGRGEVHDDNVLAAFEKKLAANQTNQTDKRVNNSTSNHSSLINSNNTKLANTFNYKDFEEDTSSPFDNIELKTINDLDILAQVLHNTQLKVNKEVSNETNGEIIEQPKEELKESSKEIMHENSKPIEALQTTIEHTKATLDKVNFSDINLELTPRQQQHPNDNIPIQQHFVNNSFQSSEQNFINGLTPQQNSYQIYHNQNFLYSPNCNRLQQQQQQQLAATTDLNNVQQIQHYIGNNNSNNYVLSLPNDQLKQTASFHHNPLKAQQISQIQQDELQNAASKSKSVPDILRELRDEVRNSEMRRKRLRNHSFNQSDESEEKKDEASDLSPKSEKVISSDEYFKKLTSEVQYLAKNISSMGFPLERVAKVAQIFGDDDKKIIEHLIPLTELLDLGFEETRISDALIKFDNNKEKALEHLIS